ncbi:ABC transporter ATP-binding protein [Jatrophihabitans lederbergiae]|uniref:ABC transporter ATP-binding protein n=1 Tax=Jatrophihabitans lederbergiae TaxID=3075547 RepID=A0ABU2JFG1_9ACTN|nr:ABC transporter ATP-binding protein [Jatrophihabitans sp. DSM 44399]MDT0263730.1 ABC transporter ATP-binding protein [Jatrophihabitans sp. DSM 44399]
MPDITVTGLVKSFGSTRALDNVSFTVADKELFTLLGPSGCGKSTTLMSIAGFQHPDAGRIDCGDTTYFDADTKTDLPAEDRNLGIVFQSYAIWPHMTVFDNVAFPLRVRKTRRAELRTKVEQSLELLEIAKLSGRYPHELSGGQQQRVALARAIVYSPTVLLLDEPFSNLDAKLRERARVWLKDLQHSLGLTTIFVTHDQDEALSMSDRILVMNEGHILQTGTPQEIYHHPSHRFVASFVGQCNLLTGNLSRTSPDSHQLLIAGTPAPLTLAATTSTGADTVTVAIRPEAITLLPEDQPRAENCWPAEIRSVEFLGDHYLYRLRVGTVDLIAATASAPPTGPIALYLPPDALVDVDVT